MIPTIIIIQVTGNTPINLPPHPHIHYASNTENINHDGNPPTALPPMNSYFFQQMPPSLLTTISFGNATSMVNPSHAINFSSNDYANILTPSISSSQELFQSLCQVHNPLLEQWSSGFNPNIHDSDYVYPDFNIQFCGPSLRFSRPQYGPPGANLFVFHIPLQWNDNDLRANFDRFGVILSSNINRNKFTGRSRGYGFVSYRSPEEAKRALQMNRVCVLNKRLVVKLKIEK